MSKPPRTKAPPAYCPSDNRSESSDSSHCDCDETPFIMIAAPQPAYIIAHPSVFRSVRSRRVQVIMLILFLMVIGGMITAFVTISKQQARMGQEPDWWKRRNDNDDVMKNNFPFPHKVPSLKEIKTVMETDDGSRTNHSGKRNEFHHSTCSF
jgi:hypothetical protein